jgi:hypothetical protein
VVKYLDVKDTYGIVTKQETAYGCYRSENDSLDAALSAANADGAVKSQSFVCT